MTNKCFSATLWSNRSQKNPPHKHRKPLKLCVIIFKSLFQQQKMFSNLSCFCCLFNMLQLCQKNYVSGGTSWLAWGDYKAKKTTPKQKSTSQDLMSSSYETNPPPCLVPSTVRDLFIRANIEYALANTWAFTNQCSFFGRPDLLPKYDSVAKFKHRRMQPEKTSTHHVCTSAWIYDSSSFLLVDEYSNSWLTW